jgi:YHS domain-containing protein
MKNLVLLTLLIVSSSFSQNIDYNLKNGFMAKGYDVVAYFNNQAIEGDKQFITTYDDVNFKFSSQENLEKFIKNPTKYIPQYGGYCAYAVALKNDKVSVNPEAFEIKDGKLYLFYNSWGTNTLDLWKQENEKELIEKADKNWNKLKFKK